MEANELLTKEIRIGNLVEYAGKIISIEGIVRKTIYHSNGFDQQINGIYAPFIPIPLTEEWLLKFGFEKKGCNWELPNFRFHVNKSVNYDGFLFCDGYSVITEKIQHVHQLQNLYFALTQKELTL